jgi:hypothetical protein
MNSGKKPIKLTLFAFLGILFFGGISGCSTYTTPGRGVNIQNLSAADTSIADLLKVQPAAPFPARIAIARVQASGYSSRSNQCYGSGQFCVVTTRDIESDASFDRIANLPQVTGVAVMNRLLLPEKLSTTMELRQAAATLKTDLLLVYSLDTSFNIESTNIGPLAAISLGFLPNKNAKVTSTASAAVFDVRTGFVYGVAEATATEEQRANFWTSSDAMDTARKKAEKDSFDKLIPEIEKLWKSILTTHVHTKP